MPRTMIMILSITLGLLMSRAVQAATYPIISQINAIIPVSLSMQAKMAPDSTGHPALLGNALFSLQFTPIEQSSPTPALNLYFYPSSMVDTIKTVIARSRMLSSCIPMHFRTTAEYIVLTTPCDLSCGYYFCTQKRTDTLWQSLHTFFDGEPSPPCNSFSPQIRLLAWKTPRNLL